jgi:thiol-disulfide isomerase/thioredoxin
MRPFLLAAALGIFFGGALGRARADLISEVRGAAASGQIESAQQILQAAQNKGGVTPELLEAMSWLARAQLAQRDYPGALAAAQKTYELAAKVAQQQPLDGERHLPIALGAALEVKAQALAATGERAKAVALLQAALAQYQKTSIAARLQKNLNLLTLEGKPAPALVSDRYLGKRPPSLKSLLGKPVLLFFWAHWCGDCKATVPVIAELRSELSERGLVVIAPTQPYGFTAEAENVPPEIELPYIETVARRSYAALGDAPMPVSTANFLTYGASSVPTIVLISRAGVVTLYHPGRMTYDELKPKLQELVR